MRYPHLLQRSFVCFSFGKVYNCTGWKLGYCIAPGQLMNEFRKIHQFNCFTCDTPKQVALAEFISNRQQYLELGKTLQEKRDYFLSLMRATRLVPLQSSGSYFQVYSYKNISDEPEMDFAIRLTKENKVATIPVSAFYHNGVNHQVLRFCFSKTNDMLEMAAARLSQL
jgi:methionine aminotransferase